jgi:AmmeMemoRadiSam system protein A
MTWDRICPILAGHFFGLGIYLVLFSGVLFETGPAWGQETDRHPRKTSIKEGGMIDKGKLTQEQGKYLIKVARETIERELFDKKGATDKDTELPEIFSERHGTFVTLTIGGNLRGCIGHIVPQESLIEGIRINAINAAFRDPRFPRLTREEWKNVRIEISSLTDPEPLAYSDSQDLLGKLRPLIDGVIIKKGFYQATFLPQVWEQLPDKKEFLTHLCLKAGLKGDEWKKGELEVSTYQVQAFQE